MPKINFELPVPVDDKTAFNKIKHFLEGENKFKKFDSEVAYTFEESSQTCRIKGSKFSAVIAVKGEKDEGQSRIGVELEIPLKLVLFKGMIKDEIEKSIKKVFKA